MHRYERIANREGREGARDALKSARRQDEHGYNERARGKRLSTTELLGAETGERFDGER